MYSIGLILTGSALILLIWRPLSDALGSRSSVYDFACIDWSFEGQPCVKGWKLAPIAVYTADVAHQFIVERVGKSNPQRFDHCVVSDRLNWDCDISDISYPNAHITMAAGSLEYSWQLRNSRANILQVGRLQWFSQALKQWNDGTLGSISLYW
jgi:hypothetical protein